MSVVKSSVSAQEDDNINEVETETITSSVDFKHRNIAALTKVFTYDSSCLSDTWSMSSTNDPSYTLIWNTRPVAYEYKPEDEVKDDLRWSSCQPIGYQTYYSPGMCPSGYKMATASVVQFIMDTTSQNEWHALCCPRSFHFDAIDQKCSRTFTTEIKASVFGTVLRVVTGTSVPAYTVVTRNSSTTTVSSGTAYVEGLRINWQVSDLSKFPQAYATSLAKRLGVEYTPTALASPGNTSGLPEISSSPSREVLGPAPPLTTIGERAGLGAGVAVFIVLFTISLAAFLVRRNRRRRTKQAALAHGELMPEMEDQETRRAWKWYLGGRWRNELASKQTPGELPTNNDPGELCARTDPAELDSRSVRSPVELHGS